ncbi:hypothetical protein DRO53_00755 [Candidatus Bathyarchaeota archaeon]|nr:MAG: hypothetical protein DRO53_00755 [Candidatus Bathyarchaeota archaeon]
MGCLARAKYPTMEYSAVETLKLLGFKPAVSREEVCCGGLLHLSGLMDFKALASFTGWNSWIASQHAQTVAALCDTCYCTYLHVFKELKGSGVKEEVEKALAKVGAKPAWNLKVFHVAEIYYKVREKISRLKKRDLKGLRVAVHHGCHYFKPYPEEALGKPESIRFLEELVETLGGQPVEYAEKNLCCGACYAASTFYDKDASLETTRVKLASMREAGAEVIIVTCPGCLSTLDEAPARLHPLPVVHVSELVGLMLGLDRLVEALPEARKVSLKPLLNL